MKTAVTNKIPCDSLAKTFFDAYREDIMKFALCHNSTEGYVRVSVTKDYTLESMRFIEGAVNMNEFMFWNEYGKPWPYCEDDLCCFRFEIYYPEINTWYRSGEFYYNFKKIIRSVYNPQ